MKIIALSFFTLLTLILVLFLSTTPSNAQVGQLWETIVGNPADRPGPVYDDEGIDQGGTGDDGLGPGEFEIPLRCNLKYATTTYNDHTPYSLDINRIGADDTGDPVFASADGFVWDDQFKLSNGQITLKHEGNWYTNYAHMQNVIVKEGQRVKAGEKIGEIDNKGKSTGPHLHVNHSLGDPYLGFPDYRATNFRQICYKRYGCNNASIRYPDRDRSGYELDKGCP